MCGLNLMSSSERLYTSSRQLAGPVLGSSGEIRREASTVAVCRPAVAAGRPRNATTADAEIASYWCQRTFLELVFNLAVGVVAGIKIDCSFHSMHTPSSKIDACFFMQFERFCTEWQQSAG